MAAVLYWFRNLAVNQVHVGSIPIGHPGEGCSREAEGVREEENPPVSSLKSLA